MILTLLLKNDLSIGPSLAPETGLMMAWQCTHIKLSMAKVLLFKKHSNIDTTFLIVIFV